MENIISLIINPPFHDWLLIIKIIFIVFASALLGFIIFAFLKTTWLKWIILQDLGEFFTYRPYGVRRLVRQWASIGGRLETGMESEAKLAVIEADSMLNDILKRMDYGGESLGERLNKLTAVSLPNIEEIRQAHQIRNNIVHDPDYRLSLDEARRVIAIYEKALTDLQAL